MIVDLQNIIKLNQTQFLLECKEFVDSLKINGYVVLECGEIRKALLENCIKLAKT